MEKSSGRKVKTIRTDNGGEYTSTRFEEYLKSEGICHERTVPKTPEQNGVAERMNRTLVETVRSMLMDAKLPHKLWGEALHSCLSQKSEPNKNRRRKTPFEAWTGKKPTVCHLRVFGCDAYAHIPKDQRGKLDPKAKKCIFVGYGEVTKGYRLYDPVCGKIIFSRNVVFNEGNDGGLGVEGARECVELELSSDDDTSTISESQIVKPTTESDHHDTSTESVSNESSSFQPIVRRSTRPKKMPDYFSWEANLAENCVQEPHTVEEALSTPEKAHWVKAMEKEMKSLQENRVWDLVELPRSRKPVGSKWVFKVKSDEDGNVNTTRHV